MRTYRFVICGNEIEFQLHNDQEAVYLKWEFESEGLDVEILN